MNELGSILHVDDDRDILAVVEMALSLNENVELRQCESGIDAIEICRDFRPALLLLDLMMPGMTGEETWEEIQKIPGQEGVQAIFLTAKADAETNNRLLQKGALGVIAKPFEPLQLMNRIEALWMRGQ